MEISEIVKVLWRRKLYILIPFIVVPLFTILGISHLPREYESEAMVFIDQTRFDHPLLLEYHLKLNLEERLPTIKKLMKGQDFLFYILGEKRPQILTESYLEELAKKKELMTIELKGPGLARLSYAHTDPAQAQAVVDRMAHEFIKVSLQPFQGIGQKLQEKFKKRDEILSVQLLPAHAKAKNFFLEMEKNYTSKSPEFQLAHYELEALQEKVRVREKQLEHQASSIIPLKNMDLDMQQVSSIIEPANLPLIPIRPQSPKFIAMGIVAGLAFGFIITVLMEFLDHSLKESRDVEQYFALSVVGRIPHVK